jgi:hypothetical protein
MTTTGDCDVCKRWQHGECSAKETVSMRPPKEGEHCIGFLLDPASVVRKHGFSHEQDLQTQLATLRMKNDLLEIENRQLKESLALTPKTEPTDHDRRELLSFCEQFSETFNSGAETVEPVAEPIEPCADTDRSPTTHDRAYLQSSVENERQRKIRQARTRTKRQRKGGRS